MLKTITTTINEEPKITAKLLCEYAETSSAIKRQSILESCKIKSPGVISILLRYNPAAEIISECMAHSFDYLDILKSYAKDFREKSKILKDKKSEYALSCAEGLEEFYKLEKSLKRLLKGIIINNTINLKGRKINLSGVDVSIRPEMMLSKDIGTVQIGFIKLCFCKTKPLTESVAHGIAALGRLYFLKKESMDFEPENCIVIDVFANKIYHAPKSDKRIIYLLEASCLEIIDRWDKI
jgi:hypothetical protein